MKRYRVTIDGRVYEVEIDDPRARPVIARVSGVEYAVDVHPARTDEAGQTHPAGDAAGTPTPSALPAEPDAPHAETAGIPPHPVEARCRPPASRARPSPRR